MKCMKLGDIIQRVAEKDVNDKLKFGWSFIPKSEWKQKIRDVNKQTKSENSDVESESKKSKKNKKEKTE